MITYKSITEVRSLAKATSKSQRAKSQPGIEPASRIPWPGLLTNHFAIRAGDNFCYLNSIHFSTTETFGKSETTPRPYSSTGLEPHNAIISCTLTGLCMIENRFLSPDLKIDFEPGRL